ncbi:MAG: huntingtin interacting protein E-like protein [Microgenomates group bacterium Gr01-1014_16]|nr:MAG: huntingtin interacting protein E-like protein [Microgenomates group bacterium Gr01-1014_16]
MKTGETSYKETSFGIIPRSQLVKLEIKGIKKGIKFLYSISKTKKAKITSVLILSLHKEAFGWIFPKWAGKFRTIQVEYSGKEAPPHYQVPQLVADLCLDLQERIKHLPSLDEESFLEELTNLLTWFQHRFVYTHPFNDYNGRTARMLTSFICLTMNLPPIEIKAGTSNDRRKYIHAMQQADSGDNSKLEKLILLALQESFKNLQAKSYR